MAKVGWIGLGIMGEPMAAQHIKAGHEVYVWGRTPAKLKPLIDLGARLVATPAELARTCDAVFLCVTDGSAVEETVFGHNGIMHGAAAGKTLIDTSTIHPHISRIMAERLHRETGMDWLDAPVSGGAIGARAATLASFVGGDEAVLERVRPLIGAYSARITHVGPSGAGQVCKTVNQSVLCVTLAAWAEALNYAKSAGANVPLVVEALEGSWSDSTVRRVHVPAMVSGEYDGNPVHTMLKDMDIVANMASGTKSPMPMQAIVTNLFRQQILMGHDNAGIAGVMTVYHTGPMGKPKS
jgi:3-hydroxyisobutyrate dehydrogenase-like beta-hydroxyacid dehydrogenase